MMLISCSAELSLQGVDVGSMTLGQLTNQNAVRACALIVVDGRAVNSFNPVSMIIIWHVIAHSSNKVLRHHAMPMTHCSMVTSLGFTCVHTW
jgi:hypothetical protein